MMHWEWIVTAAAVIGVYVLYVSLIKKKNNLKEAAAGIDIQLKKRYDLIPNLLQTAAKFMEHEKGLMTEITRLRTQALENDFQSSPAEKNRIGETTQRPYSRFQTGNGKLSGHEVESNHDNRDAKFERS